VSWDTTFENEPVLFCFLAVAAWSLSLHSYGMTSEPSGLKNTNLKIRNYTNVALNITISFSILYIIGILLYYSITM